MTGGSEMEIGAARMNPMFDPIGDVAGIPYVLILFAIASADVITAAVWWRRITHNPEDEPKSWRYHDHR